jgi:uncharacterized protein YneF (UPF0154 family)
MLLQSGTNWFIAQMASTTQPSIDEKPPITSCSVRAHTARTGRQAASLELQEAGGTCMGTQSMILKIAASLYATVIGGEKKQ